YNTNRLLSSFPGADGVKTGTTNAAGQCLVASATREGRQLIAVVLHSNNRFADAAKLLDYGFREWEEEISFPTGEVMAVLPVKGGKPTTVEAVLTERLGVSVPRTEDRVICELVLDRNEIEPLPAGTRVGEAVLKWKGRELQRVPLVTRQKASRSFIW
ncbi:MAG: D-alanyl-D-alanine carboxypeptidase, partial [Syntrophomonadaceae bacterium]|nr:D-alanyl-D-alanine carboxypeptidase [Syntrophomonadaceae bacterium]